MTLLGHHKIKGKLLRNHFHHNNFPNLAVLVLVAGVMPITGTGAINIDLLASICAMNVRMNLDNAPNFYHFPYGAQTPNCLLIVCILKCRSPISQDQCMTLHVNKQDKL